MRIGILGGTFDPIHKGHLALAEAAEAGLALDEVLFIPANRNPNKSDHRVASARHRLEMVRLAIEDRPGFSVSDIEILRGGPSYAVETMEQIQFVKPGEYWFILGADAVRGIETWKQPERLVRLCRLAVGIRLPNTLEDVLSRLSPEIRPHIDPIPLTPTDISSTQVRERLRKREPAGSWVPAAVLQYIKEHHLYEN